MKISTLRAAAPALVLSALVLVPFFGKAFTIDDTVFMKEALHALQDPLHPTAFEVVWRNTPERVSDLVPTGPVMAWLLSPAAWAGAEWAAHLIQLAMLWLGIIATVSLARRLGVAPRWIWATGLLIVGMPAVLAMAGTAMPDVAGMALGVCGMERLVAWSQDRRSYQGVLAAVLLGVAALTRSHLALLVGVGAVLLLGAGRSAGSWRDRLRLYLPLAAAPVIVGAVMLITRDPLQTSGAIVDTAAYYSSSASTKRLASNLIAVPIHWGLAMGLALPWVVLRWRTLIRRTSVLVAAGAGGLGAAAALVHLRRPSLGLTLVAAIGVAVLWDVLEDGWRRRDLVQTALGLWLLIAACAVPYVHLPPKLLVASAPAAALLLVRELSTRTGKSPWLLLGGTMALGLGLGVAILRADASFAEVGRRAAAELIAPRVAAGQRVWFVGHWGFQWYAESAGARHVTLTPPYPERGDFLVVDLAGGPRQPLLDMLANRFPGMVQVGHVLDSEPGGRIMDAGLGVGFYSNASGHLPWAWGDSPIETFLAFDL